MTAPRRFVLGFLITALTALAGPPQESPAPEIVSILKTPAAASFLRRQNFDVFADWEGRLYVVASRADLASLRADGIPYVPETEKLAALSAGVPGTLSGPNGAYHSYVELKADLFALQSQYPSLARVFDLGISLEKRHIYALKISDNPALDQDKAQVLFLGCHHAREWISVEVPFLLGRYLLENYASDAEVRRLVGASEIWIVPLVNPDGLEYSIHAYRYWRKNRRDNGGGAFGVDLNRNYGYAWGIDDSGSSPDPNSDIFRGRSAFSEPEIQTVRDLFVRKHFAAVLSYHSYAQTIIYPWGYTVLPTNRDAIMAALAGHMAFLIQTVNGRVYTTGESSRDMYLTNGELTDWTFSVSGIPSFTIELPPLDELHGGFFNAEADIDSVFRENLPAMLYLIDWSIQNPAAPDKDGPGNARAAPPVRSGRPGEGKRLIKNPE